MEGLVFISKKNILKFLLVLFLGLHFNTKAQSIILGRPTDTSKFGKISKSLIDYLLAV